MNALRSFKFILPALIALSVADNVHARIGKALNRPARLVSYSVSSGTAQLFISAVACPGSCLGSTYEVTNPGTAATKTIGYNLPFAPSSPGMDGEIYISSTCPATLAAGGTCIVEVILEPGGIYVGCSYQNVTVTAGPLSSTDSYAYGDCGGAPPEI